MKKVIKLCIAVFIVACLYYVPVDAASPVNCGDANRDEVVDARDLVRIKKYTAGNNVAIEQEVVDFNSNAEVDENDLLRAMKFQLGVPMYQLNTTSFPESVVINGIEVQKNRSVWNLSRESEEVISAGQGSTGKAARQKPIYFAATGTDFAVEITAKYATKIDPELDTVGTDGKPNYYQNDLMAGFQFSDGNHTGWLVAVQNGVRWKWGKTDSDRAYNLVTEMVLMKDTKLSVKLGLVKKGDQAYIYMNDRFVLQKNWSDMVPDISADGEMAIGLMMIADLKADVEISNYFLEIGETAAEAYMDAHNNAKPMQDSPIFTESLAIHGTTIEANAKKAYYTKNSAVALMRAKVSSVKDGDGFVFTDGNETGYLYAKDYGATGAAEMTVALKDHNFYVYINNSYQATVPVNDVLPNAKVGKVLAMGVTTSTGTKAVTYFSKVAFTTKEAQVSRYMNSEFPESMTVNGKPLSNNRKIWDVFAESDKVITTGQENTDNAAKGKALYFGETAVDFAVELTAKYTTEINPELDGKDSTNNDYYQNDLMAGFRFHDGTNEGWVVAVRDGVRWEWGDNKEYGLINHQVLMKATKIPVKFAAVKKGETLSLYINDELVKEMPWTTIAVGKIASTSKVAVGLQMIADNRSDIEISDYKYAAGAEAADAYVRELKSKKLDYQTGMDEETGRYNTQLYGMNGNDIQGADPGVFYLSKEEDAQYGGYFYMYVTGNAKADGTSFSDTYYTENEIANLTARCYRSKDLAQWEMCGAIEGYSCVIDKQDWCDTNYWAPEVIRNAKDGKYYMYFSAQAKKGLGVPCIIDTDTDYDRLFLAVAVADTPVGPFDVICDTYKDPDTQAETRIPTINFQTGCNTQTPWAAIDASPFLDTSKNPEGELYLYFNKHADSNHSNAMRGVWGVKMTDMSHPDYSTVSCLTLPNYYSASNSGIESATGSGGTYWTNEDTLNEAPFMIYENGLYYLTYASKGYKAVDYSVHQAISENPLSGFTKLTKEQGNPVLNGADLGYMNGTAHHSFVKKGNAWHIVYHRHDSVLGYDTGYGRSICADRMNFVEIPWNIGQNIKVITANGPTKGLRWLSEEISGYANLAAGATISAEQAVGAAYLNDEILPFYAVAENRKLETTADQTTITLSWKEAVSINSVMIYNAKHLENAFSKISKMHFKLEDGSYAVVENLRFPDKYYYGNEKQYIACTPAVAEFDSIKTTELVIVVEAKDKLVQSENPIHLSEVVVLGGKDYSAIPTVSYGGDCTYTQDTNMTVDGILDETVWDGKKWLEQMTLTNADGSTTEMKITGFPTEYGVYLAAVVKDSNLLSNGQRAKSNSAWELYLTANDVGENRVNDGLYRKKYIIDMSGDCISKTPNMERAVRVDGRLNSGKTKGATLEMFVPWEELGVDITKGIPTTFGVMPSYWAMVSGAEATTQIKPTYFNVSKTKLFYVFGETGASDFARAITVGGTTIESSVANWDMSGELNGVLSTSYALKGKQKPVYFTKTGNAAVVSAKIEYTTDIPVGDESNYQNDLLGGFIFTDGKNSGCILAVKNGIRVLKKIDGKWEGVNHNYYDLLDHNVLMRADQIPVEMRVVLKNNQFYIYLDNQLAKTLAVANVIDGAIDNADLAMGINMVTDDPSDIRFSNIRISTDAEEVSQYTQ